MNQLGGAGCLLYTPYFIGMVLAGVFFSRVNSLSQVHVLCSYQMQECTLYVTPTHSHRHFPPIVVALWSERT